MKWDWQTAWPVVKDILVTGLGFGLIIWQACSADPNSMLVDGGIALVVALAATHAPKVLEGPRGRGQSSPPASSPPPSPPPSSAGQHEDA